MPFNPEQGMGKYESIPKRALAASPFLALLMYHFALLKSVVPSQAILQVLASGRLDMGTRSIVLFGRFYGPDFIDSIWRSRVILLLPSAVGDDAIGSWQRWIAFADLGIIYTILLIESARRTNLLSLMRL
jgi:hypothetical protein